VTGINQVKTQENHRSQTNIIRDHRLMKLIAERHILFSDQVLLIAIPGKTILTGEVKHHIKRMSQKDGKITTATQQ
jgi:hypothetical protein